MNEVFLIGKVITEIEFKFIINNKNMSVAIFKIKLLNNSNVKVKAYDDMADYCYSKLSKEDDIFIEGNLNSNLEIVAKDIIYF